MPGHFLLRPHVCHVPNHYSATQALKTALSIDTLPGSSYRNPYSKHTTSSQVPKDTISAVAGSALRGDGTRPWRLRFHSRPNHDADVNVQNLRATLDAHRSTNRASIIHPVESDTKALPPFKRPEINYLSSENPEPSVTTATTNSEYIETPEIIHVGSEGLSPQAIADVKLQEQHGDVTQKMTAVGPPRPLKQVPIRSVQIDARPVSRSGGKILEYVGVSLWPTERWSLQSGGNERPWLDYHQGESGDGYSR